MKEEAPVSVTNAITTKVQSSTQKDLQPDTQTQGELRVTFEHLLVCFILACFWVLWDLVSWVFGCVCAPLIKFDTSHKFSTYT